MALGRSIVVDEPVGGTRATLPITAINSRSSLWPDRWPAIALTACVEAVEEAPLKHRAQVKRELPCKLCPQNTACLVAKQKELGPLLYSREHLTEPRSQEASLFPRTLMNPMLDTSRACVPHYIKPAGLESTEIVVSAWDLAWSEKLGGDWLVKITTVLNRYTGRKRVIDIKRWQGLTYAQQCALIVQQWQLYHDDIVVIETDAAQVIWAQTVEATSGVPVLRHATGDDKRSLHIGVPALLIDFSAQRWSFPFAAGGPGVEEVENLLIELGAFGYNDGSLEGVGEHDDTVMALWHAWWGLRMASGGIKEYHTALTKGRAP